MALIFINGPLGVGKTTLGEVLTEQLADVASEVAAARSNGPGPGEPTSSVTRDAGLLDTSASVRAMRRGVFIDGDCMAELSDSSFADTSFHSYWCGATAALLKYHATEGGYSTAVVAYVAENEDHLKEAMNACSAALERREVPLSCALSFCIHAPMEEISARIRRRGRYGDGQLEGEESRAAQLLGILGGVYTEAGEYHTVGERVDVGGVPAEETAKRLLVHIADVVEACHATGRRWGVRDISAGAPMAPPPEDAWLRVDFADEFEEPIVLGRKRGTARAPLSLDGDPNSDLERLVAALAARGEGSVAKGGAAGGAGAAALLPDDVTDGVHCIATVGAGTKPFAVLLVSGCRRVAFDDLTDADAAVEGLATASALQSVLRTFYPTIAGRDELTLFRFTCPHYVRRND